MTDDHVHRQIAHPTDVPAGRRATGSTFTLAPSSVRLGCVLRVTERGRLAVAPAPDRAISVIALVCLGCLLESQIYYRVERVRQGAWQMCLQPEV
jgi:hypothetical protein